ncbi:hypothetical protein [Allokutzneria sp. NRRL B-24872]|nr:hypothetical protein [Allokutzneria sp. NRRL B-24872]
MEEQQQRHGARPSEGYEGHGDFNLNTREFPDIGQTINARLDNGKQLYA